MPKYMFAVLLMVVGLPAFAQDPELIVQWKKDPIHLFVGPNHETMMPRPKSDLPPEAVIMSRQEPLLGFRDLKTNSMVYVNKNEVVTNKTIRADVRTDEPRHGRCTRALGTGFASSC